MFSMTLTWIRTFTLSIKIQKIGGYLLKRLSQELMIMPIPRLLHITGQITRLLSFIGLKMFPN